MDLHYFFKGMLRKEEIASAYLATCLKYHHGFRELFLGLIAPDLAGGEYDVAIEEDRIDVKMLSPTTTVIIENKIASGAKQAKQLLRYYRKEVTRNPERRIAAVYLAPGTMGRDEVEYVRAAIASGSRPDDISHHVSWEQLQAAAERLGHDEHTWFVMSGIEAILNAIKGARQEKYPREGIRETLREIADRAVDAVRKRVPEIELRRWSERDRETIYSIRTPVTVWSFLAFEAEKAPPYMPVGVVQADGRFHVTLRAQVKLAGKVKKGSELAVRWRELTANASVQVQPVGAFALKSDGWLCTRACGL
jgi:hypothetical protein